MGFKSALAVVSGFFLILFVLLGYETNQINLIATIFYDFASFFGGIYHYFTHTTAIPIPLHTYAVVFTVLAIIVGLALILGGLFGGHSSSSK
jgi:hypothetical protein